MRFFAVLAVGLLALGVTGAGRLSLVLDAGTLALGIQAGDVGINLNIKFDL